MSIENLKAVYSLQNERNFTMEWFKKHGDTLAILGGILSSFLWMNGKFSDIDHHFNSIEQRLVRIETVLVMKGLMPDGMISKADK